MAENTQPTYVVTATNADGSAYQDRLSSALGTTASATVHGSQDLADRQAAADQAGVTLNIHQA
ncbi:hypothetical protein OG689_28410 [Kitasatospora sp. NBC_00240]|uniref:hypothetical protein n=1 Tax=Kitasatospora sp. NBC_00240 TaxID=2903567 RepID=UPI002258E05E|nr:hypothetical protein [Kitasatospora sp. NBC_00240]MCX5213143.1 hypothetical protein [Kitasatospora sp. NBC_00240]